MLYSSQKDGFDVSNVSSKKPLEDLQGLEIILVWACGLVCLGGGEQTRQPRIRQLATLGQPWLL
jgi:hypothetical protein